MATRGYKATGLRLITCANGTGYLIQPVPGDNPIQRPLGFTGEPGAATKVAASNGLAGWPAGEDLAESWDEGRMGEALSIPS